MLLFLVFLQDVPLFEGIISDLFPGIDLPKPDFGVFLDALKENIAKRKLQAVPWFIDKIIQVSINSNKVKVTTEYSKYSQLVKFRCSFNYP